MQISHLKKHIMLGLLVSVLTILFSLPAGASEVSIISGIQLKRILDNPEIIIIDVRSSGDWRSSNIKIKGAVRKIPKILNLGHTIFPKIKNSFCIELDPMKKQVPGWHEVFYQKDIIRFPS
jgi:hypothetical protein